MGLSICGGNAPLLHTWPNAKTLLSLAEVPWNLTKGLGWRSMQPAWRSLRLLSGSISEEESSDAAGAILHAAASLPPQSLTVLCLGPASNLALALRRGPWLAERLKGAVLMGGELTHRRLDLNFMTDRGAAREILESALPTILVPIQTCAQVAMTPRWLQGLQQCPDAAARSILPKMWLQTWMMPRLVNPRVVGLPGRPTSPGLSQGFIPWDLIALLAASRPQLFTWESWAVELPSCPSEQGEPCNGTMRSNFLATVDLKDSEPFRLTGTSRADVALVPWLQVAEDEVLEQILELLCRVPGTSGASLQPGFLTQLLLATLAAFVALALGARGIVTVCRNAGTYTRRMNNHLTSRQKRA